MAVRLYSEVQLTLVRRQILQVYRNREIIALLCLHDILPVLSFQHLFDAIFDEVLIAFQRNGNQNLGFRLRRGDVEYDAVEVGHYLVN